jgi:hypothetical protein
VARFPARGAGLGECREARHHDLFVQLIPSVEAERPEQEVGYFRVRPEGTKVLRVTGYDPVAQGVETVDLLKQKLVRRVQVERETQRSKVLNTSSAYTHVEEAISEVRATDLPKAVAVYS